MNEEIVNKEIRRFLKKVGIQSQQAIEVAIKKAEESGKLKDSKTVEAVMQLDVEELDLKLKIRGNIALELQD
jgi:ribosomal protein L1